jgi:hypothetical protein
MGSNDDRRGRSPANHLPLIGRIVQREGIHFD